MGKSRAEIQKAYRDRKKAKGPAFLLKERQRTKKYYTPAKQMSEIELDERNRKAQVSNRLSRLKKKERQKNSDVAKITGTSVDGSRNQSAEPLIIKLPEIMLEKNSKESSRNNETPQTCTG
jgi:hypothetical protein